MTMGTCRRIALTVIYNDRHEEVFILRPGDSWRVRDGELIITRPGGLPREHVQLAGVRRYMVEERTDG